MPDLTLLAPLLLKPLLDPAPSLAQPNNDAQSSIAKLPDSQTILLAQRPSSAPQPERLAAIEFSPPQTVSPRSGSQLYAQRWAALDSGRLYTRLPRDSFRDVWMQARTQPTYEQWRDLLSAEARAVANGQGTNRLAVIIGDSLSVWLPSDRLPTNQLWLNQAISGDTTQGVLQRLSDFDDTRPDVIYVMAGVNDLKQGHSDAYILWNFQKIVRRLQQAHPEARIVLQSILPTRAPQIPNHRIAGLNRQLAAIARHYAVYYLDLHSQFAASDGQIQPQYTTDGIHLTDRGYLTWQGSLRWADMRVSQAEI
jgi:lysophospholipase L1-like esterase